MKRSGKWSYRRHCGERRRTRRQRRLGRPGARRLGRQLASARAARAANHCRTELRWRENRLVEPQLVEHERSLVGAVPNEIIEHQEERTRSDRNVTRVNDSAVDHDTGARVHVVVVDGDMKPLVNLEKAAPGPRSPVLVAINTVRSCTTADQLAKFRAKNVVAKHILRADQPTASVVANRVVKDGTILRKRVIAHPPRDCERATRSKLVVLQESCAHARHTNRRSAGIRKLSKSALCVRHSSWRVEHGVKGTAPAPRVVQRAGLHVE